VILIEFLKYTAILTSLEMSVCKTSPFPKAFSSFLGPTPVPKLPFWIFFLEHKFENERLHSRIRNLQEGLPYDTNSIKSPSVCPQLSTTTHVSDNSERAKSITSSRSESALTEENLDRMGPPAKKKA